MLRRPNLTLVARSHYTSPPVNLDWNLTSFPDGRCTSIRLLAVLFVLGAWFSLSGEKQIRTIRSLNLPILRIAALLYLLFALATRRDEPARIRRGSSGALAGYFPPNTRKIWLLQVLHFLALAFLSRWSCEGLAWFSWQALQPP